MMTHTFMNRLLHWLIKGGQIRLVVGSDGGRQPNLLDLSSGVLRGAIVQAEVRLNAVRVGFTNNFMVNAKFAPQSEFYLFSHQDDIWLLDKPLKAIEVKSNREDSRLPVDRPVLYCCERKLQTLMRNKIWPLTLLLESSLLQKCACLKYRRREYNGNEPDCLEFSAQSGRR